MVYSTNKMVGRAKSAFLTTTGLLLFTSSLVVHAGPAATQYKIELFDSPLPTSPLEPTLPWTNFSDISDNGMAVWFGLTLDPDYLTNFIVIEAAGIYDVKNDEFITLWEGTLDDLTGEQITSSGTDAYAINNRGELATGNCSYVNKKGEVIELTHPLNDDCTTRGISNNGLVSGFTIDDLGIWTGFVYDPKHDSWEVFLPDAFRNIAQGINSKGQVAGDVGPFADRDGYVRDSDGSISRFKVNISGERFPTQARGISDGGIVVGVYRTESSGFNGFVGRLPKNPNDQDLIPSAVFTPDNTPGCDAGVFLTRINNNGIISGNCFTNEGHERGLLLSPISKGKK